MRYGEIGTGVGVGVGVGRVGVGITVGMGIHKGVGVCMGRGARGCSHVGVDVAVDVDMSVCVCAGRAVLKGGVWGGGGSGTQKIVYQKWPNQNFPIVIFVFFPLWSLWFRGVATLAK